MSLANILLLPPTRIAYLPHSRDPTHGEDTNTKIASLDPFAAIHMAITHGLDSISIIDIKGTNSTYLHTSKDRDDIKPNLSSEKKCEYALSQAIQFNSPIPPENILANMQLAEIMEHTEFTLIQVNKNDPATWGRHQIANQITEASLSIIESATIIARHRITTPALENPDQTHTILWPELRQKAEYFLSIDASVKQNPNKCPDFLIIEYFRRLGITKTKEYVPFTTSSDKDLSEIKNTLTEIGNETLVWLLYLNAYPKIPEFDSFPKNSERWILSKV